MDVLDVTELFALFDVRSCLLLIIATKVLQNEVMRSMLPLQVQ